MVNPVCSCVASSHRKFRGRPRLPGAVQQEQRHESGGMLWVEQVGDCRFRAILTQNFSLKTSVSGEREKN
jgi:hypothetical protein